MLTELDDDGRPMTGRQAFAVFERKLRQRQGEPTPPALGTLSFARHGDLLTRPAGSFTWCTSEDLLSEALYSEMVQISRPALAAVAGVSLLGVGAGLGAAPGIRVDTRALHIGVAALLLALTPVVAYVHCKRFGGMAGSIGWHGRTL